MRPSIPHAVGHDRNPRERSAWMARWEQAQDAPPSPHDVGHDRNPRERSAMDGAERTMSWNRFH